MTEQDFVDVLWELFPDGDWPKPLHVLRGCLLVQEGRTVEEAAAEVRTTPSRLAKAVAASDTLLDILGASPGRLEEPKRKRVANSLGQLLVGRAAEIAFEEVYAAEIDSHNLDLRDLRKDRSDTDYRLFDQEGRPIYRINVKYHGSRFRKAAEMVGLDPHDCFALATYKIHGALQKEQEDHLPYFFAIVGVFDISGEQVGEEIDPRYVDFVAFYKQAPKAQRKRDVEDTLIEHLVRAEAAPFARALAEIRQQQWRVMSANRANNLLREKLFERVFALRVRSFAQAFRGAELDMHFSLSEDLIPLRRFVETLSEHGMHKVTVLASKGEF